MNEVVMPSRGHRVATKHIQELVRHALRFAEIADGNHDHPDHPTYAGLPVDDVVAGNTQRVRLTLLLEKAVADLRHAADELDAERLSCLGLRQV